MRKKMGKRSNFERVERDYYPTPYHAFEPLIPHLPQKPFTFCEPCGGDGRLIDHIEKHLGICDMASDIEPMDDRVSKKDAFDIDHVSSQLIITNPPWDRKLLHRMIDHFSPMKPTWLLFDAEWPNTIQSIPYMEKCKKIVSVGRVMWFGGTNGKDSCAWYLFHDTPKVTPTEYWGRAPKKVANLEKFL